MENDQSEGEKKALEMTDNPLNKESWRRKYSARSSISITKVRQNEQQGEAGSKDG